MPRPSRRRLAPAGHTAAPQAGTCPGCGAPSRLASLSRRLTPLTIGLLVGAAALTVFWIALAVPRIFDRSLLVPLNLKGMVVCAFIYLGPGLGLAWFAFTRPRILIRRCPRCRHTERSLG